MLSLARKLTSGHWTAHHHRVSSRFRLPSLFSRNASSDEQVISFARFQRDEQPSTLYSLSRDRKLRTWNAKTGSCIRVVDARATPSQEMVLHGSHPSPSYAPLPDNASVPFIRVVQHPSSASRYSHLVVVFLATPLSSSSAGAFVVYRASSNDFAHAGDRPCSPSSAGSELRGFEVLPPVQSEDVDSGWRLWATWDNKGTISCDSVVMDDLFQFETYVAPNLDSPLLNDWQQASQTSEQFDAAYFDNILSLEPPNPADPHDITDISSTFTTHLLKPGRFSTLTLTSALDEYIQHLPKRHLIAQVTAVYPSLSKKFAAVVGCQLEMEFSPQTGAPIVDVFRRDLKLDWLGIWARVCNLDKQARWPVGVTLFGEQMAMITREGITAPVPEDAAGIVDRLGRSGDTGDFERLPEGALKKLYLSLTPPTARSSIIAVSAAGVYISSALARPVEEGGLEAFVETVNVTLSTSPNQPIEDLAAYLWDEYVDRVLTEEDCTAIRRILSECPDLRRGLGESLDILADLTCTHGASHFTFSGLGNALVASNIAKIIASRFSLASSILLVSLFHLAEASEDEAEELVEALARAFVTYHRYRVLQYVSEQTGEGGREAKARRPKRKANGDDVLSAGFDGLKMREGEDLDMDGFDPGYSLIHALLSRRERPATQGLAISEAAMGFLSDAALLSRDQVDVEAQAADVKFVYTVLMDGHAMVAGCLADLYLQSTGMAYVRGRALLNVGQVDPAVQEFQRAAAGCRGTSSAW